MISRQFKKHDIRFIYAALPCKLAVYPEYAVDPACLGGLDRNIPQWRKLLRETAEEGVEIVDCYPAFLQQKGMGLFTKDHYISPMGAKLVAELIADYLKATTNFDTDNRWNSVRNVEKIEIPIPAHWSGYDWISYPICRVYQGDKQTPYVNIQGDGEIGILGDCNLQSYLNLGGGICANLSHELQQRVSYLGRLLPFCSHDPISNAGKGCFSGKRIVVYAGFVSAPFVRTTDLNPKQLLLNRRVIQPWCTRPIPETAFE